MIHNKIKTEVKTLHHTIRVTLKYRENQTHAFSIPLASHHSYRYMDIYFNVTAPCVSKWPEINL